MNNEIEQIAQQNDMSIEFVRWFFNEKKADCGEQWFLALGAMWEGWKAREGEVTALALTLEKSREASGCPADVDLQDWVKQLAAENVRLAAENKMAVDAVTVFSNVTHDVTEIICDELGHDRVAEIVAAYNDLGNMPATDRIVAGIKADAANQICVAFVKHKEFAGLSDDDVVTVREATDAVLHCAEVISEGADK
ncbi:TPA: hypothetical protein RFF92_000594 [Klebsiella aerogenes]|uniref:hypothetical protein n=1 Tax=Klebsiella aerogenes TaxID=548 RepID=UPI0027EE2A0E|nr:hypothetical protein [Klebsiella aerogenes]